MANKYYKDQTLVIQFQSNLDISSATNTFKYIDPDDNTGELSPTTSVDNYTIKYTNIFTKAGVWRIWIYSDFGGGVIIPSTPVELEITEQGY